MQNIAKNLPSQRHCTILSACIFTTKACIDNRGKKLVKNQYLLNFHNVMNIGPLPAEICWHVRGTQQISVGLACWLRYCSDVAQWRPSKLCTMFGFSWAGTLYIFGGSYPLTEFARCKIHFSSKSCVLLYWQRY